MSLLDLDVPSAVTVQFGQELPSANVGYRER